VPVAGFVLDELAQQCAGKGPGDLVFGGQHRGQGFEHAGVHRAGDAEQLGEFDGEERHHRGREIVGLFAGFLARCHESVTTRYEPGGRLRTYMAVILQVSVFSIHQRTRLHGSNQLPKLNTRVRFPSSAPCELGI
jgi:hypothetical protein